MRETNGYAKKPGKATKVAGISFDIGEDFDPTLSSEERNLELIKAGEGIRSNPNLLKILRKNIPAMRQKYGIKGV
jgi:hypothetical protein